MSRSVLSAPMPKRTSRRSPFSLKIGLCLTAFVGICPLIRGSSPEETKVSAYAPAEDLVRQVRGYIAEIEEGLAQKSDYEELTSSRIMRQAHMLESMALCLHHHDRQHELRETAAALWQSCRELGGAKSYEQAQAAFAKVKQAAAGKGAEKTAASPEWQAAGEMGQVMKQVSFVMTRLQRETAGKRLARAAETTKSYAAMMAAVGQTLQFDAKKTTTPEQVKLWRTWSVEMRDAAGETLAAIKAGDENMVRAALKKLDKSCVDCHRVHHRPAQ